MRHFAVGGRRSFLLRTEPVPVTVRLVARTDIVDVYAVVLLNALYGRSHEAGEVVITVILQVYGAAATGVGGKPVLREIDGSRIAESQHVRYATFLCKLEEASLTFLLGPVVGAVSTEETFGSGGGIYLSLVALLRTTRAKIKSPYRQTYAFRLALLVVF